MKRATGLLMTGLLFGCGTTPATQGPAATDHTGGPTASTPTVRAGFDHALPQGVTTAKAVLKTSTSTDTPVQDYDGTTDSYFNVPCTTKGNECAAWQGSHCGSGGICVVTTSQ